MIYAINLKIFLSALISWCVPEEFYDAQDPHGGNDLVSLFGMLTPPHPSF